MKKIIFTVCMLSTILLAGCNSNNEIKDVKNPNSGEIISSGETKTSEDNPTLPNSGETTSSGEDVSKDTKDSEYLNLYETRLSDLLASKNIDVSNMKSGDVNTIGKIKLDDKVFTLQVSGVFNDFCSNLFVVDENGVATAITSYWMKSNECELSIYNDSYLLVVGDQYLADCYGLTLFDKNMKEVFNSKVSIRDDKYVYSLENNKILFSAPEYLSDEEKAAHNLSERFENYCRGDYELSIENGEVKSTLLSKDFDDLEFHSYVP